MSEKRVRDPVEREEIFEGPIGSGSLGLRFLFGFSHAHAIVESDGPAFLGQVVDLAHHICKRSVRNRKASSFPKSIRIRFFSRIAACWPSVPTNLAETGCVAPY